MLLALALAFVPALSDDDVAFDGVSITPPPLEELQSFGKVSEQLRERWSGKLGESTVDVNVFAVSRDQFWLESPEDVLELVEANVEQGYEREFRFQDYELLDGEFGFAPYVALGSGVLRAQDGAPVASFHCAAGRLENFGYTLELTCAPPLDEDARKVVRAYLEDAIEYEGEEWDPEWTDEEAEERWRREAPDDLADDVEIHRTKHYIILTNSAGKKAFGREMEDHYKAIRKVFPFESADGQRLMPVFLFKLPEEYYDFYVKRTGISLEQAKRSKGHASADYYATDYVSPKDAVHIHEATHQIFQNRLRLSGGGSWFQEGVAEYMETRDNQRNNAARLVEKERHIRLPEFFQMRSLLYSSDADNIKGGSAAGDAYKQAAVLIEFLRESKFGKKRFLDFVHAIGRVPRGDLAAIDAVLQRIYDVDSVGLDAEFVEYCKKR